LAGARGDQPAQYPYLGLAGADSNAEVPMAQSDPVLYSVDARVALITVNDPDRRNAFTDEMSARLREAVERAEADPDVHAVVVTGAGKAFCAGADLSALGAAGGGAAESGLRRIYDGFMAVGNCRLPTIAAVNGAAVGAGLNLALAADVRIAGPGALFDARFQKLGLHPGGGATWMLQRAVGPQVARAALLFGMRFDAEAAVRHGLALSVADDPVAAALELAAGPAAAPREVVLATKATMRATINPGSVDTEQHDLAMRTELGPQASSIQSPEFASRLAAARRR
jgi:enoyl-CoA hydratase